MDPKVRRYLAEIGSRGGRKSRRTLSPDDTPISLIEQLRRRGRFRPEEVERLDLARPFDLVAAKQEWNAALDDAEAFVRSRPLDELGCLYYDRSQERFVAPQPDGSTGPEIVPHFGRPGGVLPQA